MSASLVHIIQELSDDLKSFNRNDVLVNFADKEYYSLEDGKTEIVLPAEGEILKTFKKAKTVFRESGTSVFCVSKGILNWEWNGSSCMTPIVLCPADIKLDKVRKVFTISWDDEECFLNPFLIFQFKKQYDFTWPEIDFSSTDWSAISDHLKERGFNFEITPQTHFGNFHHHRFAILRELDGLIKADKHSSSLTSLFFVDEAPAKPIKREPRTLFPADPDQLKVFDEILSSNLVVHGPPGTGKSQVLANMLGKNLSQQLNTLVVSEKRVALEVLNNKLENVGLNRFIFLQGPKPNAQSLLNQLKETWQFLESYSSTVSPHLPVSKLKLDGLQFKLNTFSKDDLIGGVSFLDFRELTKNLKLKKASYVGTTSNIRDFIKKKDTVKSLFKEELNKIVKQIPKKKLEKEDVFNFDEKVKSLQTKFKSLNKKFKFDTKEELEELIKRATFAQILSNEIHKDYFTILQPESPVKKKFIRWSKKYFVLKKELGISIEKNDHWKKPLSHSETEVLLTEIKSTGYFKKRKVNKHIKSILKSPFDKIENALKDNLDMLKKRAAFRNIEKKLTEIGVKEESEIFWVKDLISKMAVENWAVWTETDAKFNRELSDANLKLNDFYQFCKNYFNLGNEDSLTEVFDLFKKHFTSFLSYRKKLLKLPANLYKHMGNCDSFEQLQDETFKSNWIRFVEHFPAFKDFEMNDLDKVLQDILHHEAQESDWFAEDLLVKRKEKFEVLNSILQTPARKLTEEEKSRKVTLRKGRSLLIKEFGKTRSHPTIRELLQSDAREWIFTLLPIWMVNPAQVGDFFPLEEHLFDMAFFDEATQIPLSNALGSLQRSDRAMILGDEHQMSPSFYFKAGDSEPIDLLHQSRFNWPKVMLRHHYRSQHPELIDFSNRHFYEGKLIAFPNANREENAVELHRTETGVYHENVNKVEAKALATFLSVSLKTDCTLGVVAFSETQLKCIYEQLSNADKILLEEKIESNNMFFRSLENVQGEECDHLIISLGYAKNEEGKLNLNFGPLNRKTGRRRLNVLLSRAKHKIDFFTSISAGDLSLSDNDSLNLLRLFLLQSEGSTNQQEMRFPYDLKVKALSKSKKSVSVEFENLIGKLNDADELVTFYRVLTQRGWKIIF